MTSPSASCPRPIYQPRRVRRVLAVLAALAVPASLSAQSCILTRLDSPVLNAFDKEFNRAAQKWQVDLGWRYGYSFRHFVGTDEQEQRLAEHSQVVNNVNLADLSVHRNFGGRASISVGVPYLSASRSGALRSGGTGGQALHAQPDERHRRHHGGGQVAGLGSAHPPSVESLPRPWREAAHR